MVQAGSTAIRGRNAHALSLGPSRAVPSDARSTQIYASVSSGWEQRCLFWLSGWPKACCQIGCTAEPLRHTCKLCVSAAIRELHSDCVPCKRFISRTAVQQKLHKALSAASDASRCGASRVERVLQ